MHKYDEIQKELSRAFSDAEIASGYILPENASEAETAVFLQLRFKALQERTEEQRLLAELMRMKLIIRDYLEQADYDPVFSFSKQLSQYISLLGRSQRSIAAELGLHPTKLSRLLNARENPNVELAYRLEKHCGNIIPAVYWWKLHAKRIEEEIKTNEKLRKSERSKVKNPLQFRA